MSTFFDAVKTFEEKRGARAASLSELMRAAIELEITGEEANQVRCVCASVADALEGQLASNAEYFFEDYTKTEWWRRTGKAIVALGIFTSEDAAAPAFTAREVAEHRATLMACARNADSFLIDADGRVHMEGILARYRAELGQPLETWQQRMEAITAGAVDYDDALDLILSCICAIWNAQHGIVESGKVGAPQDSYKGWDHIAETAFQFLCQNPDDLEARRVLTTCGAIADGEHADRAIVEQFTSLASAQG